MGDTATITFINPFQKSLLLVRWGNALLDLTATKLVLGQPGLSNISFPVTEACLGGCTVTVVLTAPRGQTIQVPTLLPISVLFDPDMPAAIVQTIDLSVPQTPAKLNVAVESDASVVAPGSEAGFSVDLTDMQGNPVQGTFHAINLVFDEFCR